MYLNPVASTVMKCNLVRIPEPLANALGASNQGHSGNGGLPASRGRHSHE